MTFVAENISLEQQLSFDEKVVLMLHRMGQLVKENKALRQDVGILREKIDTILDAEDNQTLDVNQVSEKLNCCAKTVRTMITDGRLKAVSSRPVRVTKGEVKRYLSRKSHLSSPSPLFLGQYLAD